MDEKIKELVILGILFGAGRATFLQLCDGTEFHSPRIIPHKERKTFGVEIDDGEDKGQIRKVNLSEVEIVY